MPSTRRASAAQQARQAASHAARVRRVVEESCNQGDLAVLDALLAPAGGADAAGLLPVRQGLAVFRAAMPDARWTIVEQIAAGDTVVTQLAVQGTFAGPLVGLAPPGRPAILSGVAISRFADERLVELWLQADLLGFLQQLGVMPPLALDKAVTVARVLRAQTLLDDPMGNTAWSAVSHD
jgi:predicted ester cyclase